MLHNSRRKPQRGKLRAGARRSARFNFVGLRRISFSETSAPVEQPNRNVIPLKRFD